VHHAARLTAAHSDNIQFVVTSAFSAQSNSYRVGVKPASTEAPIRSTVRLMIEATNSRLGSTLVEGAGALRTSKDLNRLVVLHESGWKDPRLVLGREMSA
jgi:hypothetical protein